jgi:hypothetical protein
MASFRNQSFAQMVEQTLKSVSAALRDEHIPYCLVGSLSAWARGGPESSHDLDFGIKYEDSLKVATALEKIGMEIEIPPEDWLFKAWDTRFPGKEATMVDLIYAPSGVLITDQVIERADTMDILAQKMPVLDATDLMTMKLLSLREQNLNFSSTIATARSIREQINWPLLYERTKNSPYAQGFFTMIKELELIDVEKEPEHHNNIMADMQKAIFPESVSEGINHLITEQRKQLISHVQQSKS